MKEERRNCCTTFGQFEKGKYVVLIYEISFLGDDVMWPTRQIYFFIGNTKNFFFKKDFSWQLYFTLRVFARNLLSGNRWRNTLLFCFDVWPVTRTLAFTSYKPIHYILEYGESTLMNQTIFRMIWVWCQHWMHICSIGWFFSYYLFGQYWFK